MSAPDEDLLFGLTALELQLVTREQLTHATTSGSGNALRDRLIRAGILTEDQASAIDTTLAKRRAEVESRDPMATAPPGAHTQLETPLSPSLPAPIELFVKRRSKRIPSNASERFSVLRLHQQGGLGRVSVASDAEFNREIALKEIRTELADDPDSRLRFLREAEITGALEHPGVVPVYSLGQSSDGRPYYAMRFIRGVDLQQAITSFYQDADSWERPLRFRRLLSGLVAVCQTLDYAHSRGVLHRDVKPSNIMLGDYGETLIVDWGLAKLVGEQASNEVLSGPLLTNSFDELPRMTQAGKVVGTPMYMSPEQAEGRIDLLNAATDIYSLGATLYQLMTGATPFDGDAPEMLVDVRRGRFPAPSSVRPGVSKPLEAVCLKAMALNPAERYQTAGELAEDIERFLADEPVLAHKEPLLARVGRWARNHRALVLSLASAVLVALVMLSGSVALLTAANQREREAAEAAVLAATEAEQERLRAERNYAIARTAVQDYYVSVSEETLLQQPGMQPLRDKLLQQALLYYQQFLEDHSDEAQLLAEVSLAHFYAGRITETIGSLSDAILHYEEAEQLQRRLTESGEDAVERRVQLATTLNAQGRVLFKSGDLESASSVYQSAIVLRAELAEDLPGDADRARDLANSMMNLALIKARLGDPESALPDLERAQALRLAHKRAGSAANLRDLGEGAYNLAAVRLMLGDVDQAEVDFRDAIEHFASVANADPGDLRNRHRLGMTQRLLATTLNNVGDQPAAVDGYRRSIDTLQELTSENPMVIGYAADLAAVRMDLAQLLNAAGDSAAAKDQITQAVAMFDIIEKKAELTPRLRRDHAVALRFWGEMLAEDQNFIEARQKLREAYSELQDLIRDSPTDHDYLDELTRTEQAMDAIDEREKNPVAEPAI